MSAAFRVGSAKLAIISPGNRGVKGGPTAIVEIEQEGDSWGWLTVLVALNAPPVNGRQGRNRVSSDPRASRSWL